MRIGVIGGGAAGLITAWLLEDQHEVVLFESENRLGGHAHTITVELGGKPYSVDAGIHYFSDPLQPTFMKLLRTLDAPFESYRPTSTFHDARTGWTVCMPPFGGLARMRGLAEGRTFNALLGLRKAIGLAVDLVEGEGDFSITLEDFIKPLLLPPNFAESFLYPYLSSFWGTSAEEVRTYSARNVLSYLVLLRPPIVRQRPVCEMHGGMQAYVDLLRAQLKRTSFRTNQAVEAMGYVDGRYRLPDGEQFDQIVVATNAEQARHVLRDVAHASELRRALMGVEYFDTTIAVHSDSTLLPYDRRLWSTVNGVFDGVHCATTDRAHANRHVDLFRSWTTHAVRPPKQVHAEVAFRHPRPNPAYFRAQAQLSPLQGSQGLWLAGMYVRHYDTHEGCVQSAMTVAQALAPDSARLASLS